MHRQPHLFNTPTQWKRASGLQPLGLQPPPRVYLVCVTFGIGGLFETDTSDVGNKQRHQPRQCSSPIGSCHNHTDKNVLHNAAIEQEANHVPRHVWAIATVPLDRPYAQSCVEDLKDCTGQADRSQLLAVY